MPLAGRDVSNLLVLAQGVQANSAGSAGAAVMGGMRGDNNNFLADGFNIQNPATGGMQTRPPLDALGEFKVQVTNYSAEYGRLVGGVVNMALKSGGNKYRGSVFEYFRNDDLDARNFFDQGKSKLRLNQFGLELERWYKLHHDEIRKRDPNHLILGDKLQPAPDWLIPIVSKYVDVNVVQWRGPWKEQVKAHADRLYRVTGKPIVMGDATLSFVRPQHRENGVKGWQTGIHNCADMCRASAQYVEDAFREPYFIGYHHCGYIEQWDGSERGDVATNENGFINPFEKIDPAVDAMVVPANRNAPAWHAKAGA